MKAPNHHLNLLRPDEQLSSSPVRVRVMLPVIAVAACVGIAIWWGILFMQLLLLRGQIATVKADLEQRKQRHSAILAEMALARDRQAELDQLAGYAAGRRSYGTLLARLADSMPAKIQLTSLVIPEPGPQQLRDPKNPRIPPLLGPTNVTEAVAFRIAGRTVHAEQVTDLLKRFNGANVTNLLVVTPKKVAQPSPRMRSFRQEERADKSGRRLLSFEVEYRGVERRFAK